MVFAFVLALPSVSAAHDSHELVAGDTYTREVSLTQGKTLFVGWESNASLNFMLVTPNGTVVRNLSDTTHGGTIYEVQQSGDYRMVWQSLNDHAVTLSFDYYNDARGMVDQITMFLLVGLVAVVAVVAIVLVFMTRKKKA